MSLSMQLSSNERQAWEDFCQRLGASVRASNWARMLANPYLSQPLREQATSLLVQEMTIAVMHRDKKALPA